MSFDISAYIGGHVEDLVNASTRLDPLHDVPTAPFEHGQHVEIPGPLDVGSPAEDAELGAIEALQTTRTPQKDLYAIDLDKHGALGLWMGQAKAYRSQVGHVKGWLGTAAVATSLAVSTAAVGVAKLVTRRPRPYVVTDDVQQLGPKALGSSYWSGHTSNAFAAASVMSALDPARQNAYYDLAGQVGAARVYSGMHFPTDVQAGADVGNIIGGKVSTLFGIRHWHGAAPAVASPAAS